MLMPHNRGPARAYRKTKKVKRGCILYTESMNKGNIPASYFQRCRPSHGAREAPEKALMMVVVVVAVVRWRWYIRQEE